MGVRWLNVACGTWLFASAFLWPHSSAQFVNAATCGVLIATNALLALGPMPAARFANIALAVWLAASAFLLPSLNPVTRWNHLLFGVVVVLASMVPAPARVRRLHLV